MSPRLYSGRKWDGFKATGYQLDLDKVLALPLKLLPPLGREDADSETPTTLGEIYDLLKDKQITQESLDAGASVWLDLETVEGKKLRLGGPDFNRRLLHVMLQLRQEGISPFVVWWFFYDDDVSRDGQYSYTFFLVHARKLVRENITFYDHSSSGFEPSVFVSLDHSNETWANEPAEAEAWTRYFYRKFYAETFAGQLMMLRTGQAPDIMTAIAMVARSVKTIRILLWVLLILAFLEIVHRW